jgi:hypothetical protein
MTLDKDIVFAEAGDIVTFTINLEADTNAINGQLGLFKISDTAILYYTILSGITDSISYNYTIPDNAEDASEIILTFEAVDGNSGNQNTKTVKIYITNTNIELKTIQGKNLNYNNGNTTLWNLSSPFMGISVDTIIVLNPTAPVAEIDVAFVWQEIYGITLASPNSSWFANTANENTTNNPVWSTIGKNEIKLQKISNINWDDVTAELINSLTVTSTYVDDNEDYGIAATNLIEGDLVAFETPDGIKGIIKVVSAQGETKSVLATGTLVCDIKYIANFSSITK